MAGTDHLELLVGRLVPHILVRVELDGHFAVCLLDLQLRGIGLHAKDVVVGGVDNGHDEDGEASRPGNLEGRADVLVSDVGM
jgi:hypothetical protein